jgi:hypothetical protein
MLFFEFEYKRGYLYSFNHRENKDDRLYTFLIRIESKYNDYDLQIK